MNIQSINPETIEHEGFTYLVWNDECFKGCSRCGGSGHYSFDGVSSVCYKCGNTAEKLGDHLGSKEAAEKWCHNKALAKAARERKREQERLAKEAKMEAKREALKATDPEVYEFLMAVDLQDSTDFESYEEWAGAEAAARQTRTEKDSFIIAMAENLRFAINHDKPFTARMIEVVRDKMAKRAAKAAEAAANPAPTGRVVVTGEIISAKIKDTAYGDAYKIVIKDDNGYKVYASIPKAQSDEAYDEFHTMLAEQGISRYDIGHSVWFLGSDNEPERFPGVKGKRITFTATVEPSKDDPSFGFASRPTKGAWLAAE